MIATGHEASVHRRHLADLELVQAMALPLLLLVGFAVISRAFDVSLDDTLIRATPFVFTGLAVAVPARAGLVNIGGEGQFVAGMVFAAGAALALDDKLPATVLLPVLGILGALGGLVWAGIAAVLKVTLSLNEALSTLLLNFVAPLMLGYLVFGPWKDPATYSNLPQTAEFEDSARLPVYGLTQLHLGIPLALVAAVVVWVMLDFTRWGFRARVLGGNPEAARRSGIAVRRTLFVALVAGGALAGLGGMIELTGIEGRLRPGIGVGFGYIGFLASWLVGHRPLEILPAALLLASISIAGDSLQIDHNLPSTSVYILMAVVVLAVLGLRGGTRRAEG
ncbi:MAG TPA: ABC transporter permease [Gaiella sp.]|jgi:simple sugar transport system permease protein